MDYRDKIFAGDCEDILAGVPDDSIAQIFTPPPCAGQRRHICGGVHADSYNEGFIHLGFV